MTLEMRTRALALMISTLALAACGGEVLPGEDAGGREDAGGGMDAASGACSSDVQCDDGLFCNGPERCRPSDAAADERGCVPAEALPCPADERCDEATARCLGSCDLAGDLDGDGHLSIDCGGDDCDDMDANRFPGNVEVCNGTDEDCNTTTLGFVDADGDGSGSSACCNPQTDGPPRCGPDCNDEDATIRPGVPDGPTSNCDTIDNDCDGTPDVGCPCVDGASRHCGPPEALAMIGECRPGEEFCIGGTFSGTCSGSVGPTEELCDGRDNDCDGTVDEGVLRTYYRDADGDGFGAASEMTTACSAPAGYSAAPTDCDDASAAVNPAAAEVCDGADNNCAMGADEGCECVDGATRDCGPTTEVGECAFGTQRCIGGTWAECIGAVLAQPETCNGRDDDCDGTVDDGVRDTFYVDADGDGFGRSDMSMQACTRPAGHTTLSGDCNDSAGAIHPGVSDVCDGVDNDCDGTADPGCACTNGTTRPCGPTIDTGECAFGTQRCIDGGWAECVGAVLPRPEDCNGRDDDCDGAIDDGVLVTYYRDADGDGFGASATTLQACAQPVGYVGASTDCNDGNPAINPAAADLCDGIDNNCDGVENPSCTCVDGTSRACGAPDGMGGFLEEGACNSGRQLCVGGVYTSCIGAVFPETETCNGVDDDCDGLVDDGVTVSCYEDRDGDTYGFGPAQAICGGSGGFGGCPTAYSSRTGDCDDARAATSPAAAEACNGIDDDCSGTRDDGPSHQCVQDSLILCTTQCATSGQRSCNSSCQWREPACQALVETCNYCDDDGDGTSSDDAFVAAASRLLDAESCNSDYNRYGSATCFSDAQVQLVNNTSLAGAAWARRPVLVGYRGFHVRVNSTVIACSSEPAAAGWALVFAENSAVSLGATGGTNVGVPTTMRGLSVEWHFGNSPDRVQARAWSGSGASLIQSANAPTTVSCGSGGSSESQTLDVTYLPADAALGRPATLTVAVVEGASPPVILFESTNASVPSFPAGTLLRFGMTASTSTTAVAVLPVLGNITQVSVCDSPYDGQVRIAGGGATGRLEIFHQGQWGTVCDDNFGTVDANVACRQLGYASGTVRTDVAGGSDRIWLDEVGCAGTELGLGICPHPAWGTHDCTHVDDVGVTCTP